MFGTIYTMLRSILILLFFSFTKNLQPTCRVQALMAIISKESFKYLHITQKSTAKLRECCDPNYESQKMHLT
jgi:hypothetical protein